MFKCSALFVHLVQLAEPWAPQEHQSRNDFAQIHAVVAQKHRRIYMTFTVFFVLYVLSSELINQLLFNSNL